MAEALRGWGPMDAGRMNENVPEAGSAIAAVAGLASFQPLHAAEAKVVAGLGSGDFNRIGGASFSKAQLPPINHDFPQINFRIRAAIRVTHPRHDALPAARYSAGSNTASELGRSRPGGRTVR